MGWSPVREAWARVLEEVREACRRAARAAELAAETGAAAPAEAAARECARLAALLERLAERDVLPGNPRWRHHFSPPRAAVAGGGRLAALAVKGGSDFFRALFPPSGRSGLALFSTLAGYRVAILVFEAGSQPRSPILWMSGAPAEFARSAVYRKAAVWGASAVADRVAWSEGLERSPDAAAALRLAVSALLSCAGGGDRVLFALPAAEADRLLLLASNLGLPLRRLPTGARRLRFLLLDAAGLGEGR